MSVASTMLAVVPFVALVCLIYLWRLYWKHLKRRFINTCLKGVKIVKVDSLGSLNVPLIRFSPKLVREIRMCYDVGDVLLCVGDGRFVLVDRFEWRCSDVKDTYWKNVKGNADEETD